MPSLGCTLYNTATLPIFCLCEIEPGAICFRCQRECDYCTFPGGRILHVRFGAIPDHPAHISVLFHIKLDRPSVAAPTEDFLAIFDSPLRSTISECALAE